jgi:hypothetical protein
MGSTERRLGALGVLALAVALAGCRGGSTQKPFTSEYYKGGTRLMGWAGTVKGQVLIQFFPMGIDYRRYPSAKEKDVRVEMVRYIPQEPGLCYLDIKANPGALYIEEQPSPHNGYTCRIRIRHDLTEWGRYEFDLYFLAKRD